MALKTGRQSMIVAEVDINFADVSDGVALPVIAIPAGAVVVGGYVFIDTVFDSTTTDTIDVGNGGATGRYLTGFDIHTGADPLFIVLGVDGTPYAADDTVDAIWNQTGDNTTEGAIRLVVWYYIEDRRDLTAGGVSRVTV